MVHVSVLVKTHMLEHVYFLHVLDIWISNGEATLVVGHVPHVSWKRACEAIALVALVAFVATCCK